MRTLLCSFFLVCCATVKAQQTVITKTKIPLGIEVRDTSSQRLLDIATLCDGFDENNKPLNLVIPVNSRAKIFLAASDASDQVSYWQVNSKISVSMDGTTTTGPLFQVLSQIDQKPAASDDSFNTTSLLQTLKRIDNSTPIFDQLIPSGESEYLQIVRRVKNPDQTRNYPDSVDLWIKGDLEPVKIKEIYLTSEMSELVKETSSKDIFDLSTRSYQSWKDNGYISDQNLKELPQAPVFPNDENDLFIKLSRFSRSIRIYLEKSGTRKEIADPFSFLPRVLYLSNLTSGDYKVIIEDEAIKYGSKQTTYEFTIQSNFWNQGGYWLAILLPLFIILFLVYRTYTKAKINQLYLNKKLSDAELKAIRAQLNPHFLFNALNAIQNLVNKQDTEVANQYIVKLSRLLRIVLAHSDDTLHSLGQELEMSKLYIELEQMRTPFTFEMSVAKETSQNVLVPSMILQPYLENAVIHGIVNGKGDHIRVRIFDAETSCILQVDDNGKGSDKNNGNGKGMSLGKERLDIIARQLGDDIKMDVTAMKLPEGGFRVTIEIPKDL